MDVNSKLEGHQPSSGGTGDDAAEVESGGGEEVCGAPSPSAMEQDGVFEEKVDQVPAGIDVNEERDTGASDGDREVGQDDGASVEITEVSMVQPGGGAGGDLENKVEGEEDFNFMDADSSDEDQDDGEGAQKDGEQDGEDNEDEDDVDDVEDDDEMSDEGAVDEPTSWAVDLYPPLDGNPAEAEGDREGGTPLWEAFAEGAGGATCGDEVVVMQADEGGGWGERAARALDGQPAVALLKAIVREGEGGDGVELEQLKAKLERAEAAEEAVNAALSGQVPLERGREAFALAAACGADLGKRAARLEACIKTADGCIRKGSEMLDAEGGMGDLRALKSLLSDLERLPFALPLEAMLREKWDKASGWIEKARAILTARPRTRHGREGAGGAGKMPEEELHEVIREGCELGLQGRRPEMVALSKQVEALRDWRASVQEELGKDEGASSERLARVQTVLEIGDDLPIDVAEEARPLKGVVWRCKAKAAMEEADAIPFNDLMGLCTNPFSEPGQLLEALSAKLRAAEAWMGKSKMAMNDKRPAEVLKGLLAEAPELGVECEEEMLLEFHVESGEAWRERAQKVLEQETVFLLGLRGMLREGDRIAMDLPEIHQLEERIERYEKERREAEAEKARAKAAKEDKGGDEESEEEDPENWACCDGCSKWRRLGQDALPEGRAFFCLHVAKSCDDAEDAWDEEEEMTAKYESDGKTGGAMGDDMDDIPLSERKLFLPGALVFAQFAYYPFWPGVIRDPENHKHNHDLMRSHKRGQALVEFFGTKNFSFVDRRKTVPFNANIDPNPKPIKSVSFKKAVAAAAAMQAQREARANGRGDGGRSDEEDGSKKGKKSKKKKKDGTDGGQVVGSKRKASASLKWLNRDKATLKWERKKGGDDSSDDDTTLADLTRKRARESDSSDSSEGEGEGSKRSRGEKKEKREKKIVTEKRRQPEKKPRPSKPPQPAAPAPASKEALLPKWFLDMPATWQGSYSSLCEVKDAETRLRERMAKIVNHDDVRREVRNMVTVSLLGALQSGGGAAADTGGGIAVVSKVASKLELALWQRNGAVVNKEYRGQYRVAAMALRSRPILRTHVMSGKLEPDAFAKLSKPSELEAYAVNAMAPPPATPTVPRPAAIVKLEPPKAPPPKLPNIPVLPAKLAPPPKSASPRNAKPRDDANANADDDADEGTPTPPSSPKRDKPRAPHHHPSASSSSSSRHHHQPSSSSGGGKSRREAAPGEREWQGIISKQHAPDVAVSAVHVYGASVRDLMPHTLKVCGRMKHDELKRFLQQLDK